jgi:hypothetical protein
LAEALGRAGRIAEGLVLIEAGIEQFEANCFTADSEEAGQAFRQEAGLSSAPWCLELA